MRYNLVKEMTNMIPTSGLESSAAATTNGIESFRAGTKVRTVFGEIKEVADAYGCQVIFTDGGWAHPTKCFPVKEGRGRGGRTRGTQTE